MKNKVSVVIVTRNRSSDLMECLDSLKTQTFNIDELVIVDNNSIDGTKVLVKKYLNNASFKVKYVLEKKIGFPYVYNRGLKEASGDWIAFIDDDCVADVHWYKNIKKLSGKFPQLSAILGYSSEYWRDSVFALTKSFIDEIGKIGAIKDEVVLDHEILDSKNIIYSKKFLIKNNIKFDASLLEYAQGASEDCDLGMQIYLAGGIALYSKKIKVLHKDPTSFISFYKKLSFTLRNHLVYERKWEEIRKKIETKRSILERIKIFADFIKKYSLNTFTVLLVLTNVIFAYIITKILRIVMKNDKSLMGVKQI